MKNMEERHPDTSGTEGYCKKMLIYLKINTYEIPNIGDIQK